MVARLIPFPIERNMLGYSRMSLLRKVKDMDRLGASDLHIDFGRSHPSVALYYFSKNIRGLSIKRGNSRYIH